MDLWYKNAVFYEIYLRAFCDGNGDGKGDFVGLLSKIDYIANLGIDCIWVTPFYPSPLRDDGYDVADYRSVHPDYGTMDDLKAVIDAVHARGMRIVSDLVMNHTSDQHPWFIEARSSRDNPKRDWYVWSDTNNRYSEARVIFLDTLDSNWTFDEHTGQYYWHRFYSEQPDLNYDNPEVRQEMLDIVDFWLEMGLDGFRADAVPYLFEREDTNCENLPQTHEFLKELRRHMDVNWPGRILLAEANQWPRDVREYFGDDDEFHMAFHFPIMPRLFMALKEKSTKSIVSILEDTPDIPENTQWCIFLRNHDELTLEMVSPMERAFMWHEYAPDPRMRLNLGIRRRLSPLLDNDQRRIELLNALLFSLPGSPIIYYGDEIGMGDNIWLDDRDGVRTPMQWHGGHHAGFSEGETIFRDVIDDEEFGYQKVNVSLQWDNGASILSRMRHMMHVRRENPAFGLGTFLFEHPDNETILAYWRAYERERILVVANVTDKPVSGHLRLSLFPGHAPYDLLTDETLPPVTTQPYAITLAPYQYRWLKI